MPSPHGVEHDAAGSEPRRRAELLGQVWARHARSVGALPRMVRAEVIEHPAGPELLGLVIRHAGRHTIFMTRYLRERCPTVHRRAPAHEVDHILRGVGAAGVATCRTETLLDADELATWAGRARAPGPCSGTSAVNPVCS